VNSPSQTLHVSSLKK
jgi:polypyrimidine tract-binding protein 2